MASAAPACLTDYEYVIGLTLKWSQFECIEKQTQILRNICSIDYYSLLNFNEF